MALAEPITEPVSTTLPRSSPALAALPLVFASVAVVLAYWAVDSSSPALTDLRDDLALSGTVAGLVFSFFFAGRLVGSFPAAKLVEQVGPAITAAAGGVTLLVGAVIAVLARNAPMVLVARFFEGAGVALIVSAALLSILRARPGDGAAMTLFTLTATIGGILGISSGGVLTEALGWRTVFAMHMALGGGVLALALFCWLRGRTPSLAPLPQSTAGEPILGSRRVITTGLVANFLVFINYSVFMVSLPLYADEEFGASPERISTLLLTMTISHLVLAYPVGAVIKRHGSMRVLIAGNMITALGMLLVLTTTGIWWLIGPLVVYSLGQVAASTSSGDFLLQRGGRGGKAVGYLRFSSDLGLVIGPMAVGALADLAGYQSPFLILPVLTAAGLLFTISRLRGDRRLAASTAA